MGNSQNFKSLNKPDATLAPVDYFIRAFPGAELTRSRLQRHWTDYPELGDHNSSTTISRVEQLAAKLKETPLTAARLAEILQGNPRIGLAAPHHTLEKFARAGLFLLRAGIDLADIPDLVIREPRLFTADDVLETSFHELRTQLADDSDHYIKGWGYSPRDRSVIVRTQIAPANPFNLRSFGVALQKRPDLPWLDSEPMGRNLVALRKAFAREGLQHYELIQGFCANPDLLINSPTVTAENFYKIRPILESLKLPNTKILREIMLYPKLLTTPLLPDILESQLQNKQICDPKAKPLADCPEKLPLVHKLLQRQRTAVGMKEILRNTGVPKEEIERFAAMDKAISAADPDICSDKFLSLHRIFDPYGISQQQLFKSMATRPRILHSNPDILISHITPVIEYLGQLPGSDDQRRSRQQAYLLGILKAPGLMDYPADNTIANIALTAQSFRDALFTNGKLSAKNLERLDPVTHIFNAAVRLAGRAEVSILRRIWAKNACKDRMPLRQADFLFTRPDVMIKQLRDQNLTTADMIGLFRKEAKDMSKQLGITFKFDPRKIGLITARPPQQNAAGKKPAMG